MSHSEMTINTGIKDRLPAWIASRDWGMAAGIIILTVATCLAYSNSFVAPFHLDDLHNIITNHSIKSLWPIWTPFIPPSNTGMAGRPLANFTLAVNYAISGERVWSYHLLNLLIHLIAGWALFGIVRRTLIWGRLADKYRTVAPWLALIVALLWVVHPLHTSAVTYIIQRCESLMGMLFFLTLYMAIRGWQSSRPFWWQVGAVLTCLAGMGSKEVMVVCPVMILLYDLLFVHQESASALKSGKWFYLGLFMCLGVMAILVFSSGKLSAPALQKTYSAWEQITTQPQVIFHYVRLVFWPSPLVFDYRWPLATTMMDIIPYAAVILGMLAVVVWTLWKRWPIGYLGAWFFITLAPSSSFVPQPDFAFEYRMYLALAAVIVLVVLVVYEGVQYLQNAPPKRGWGAEIIGETRSWTDFGPQAYSPYVEEPTGQCPEPILNGHGRKELTATKCGLAIGCGTFPPGNERCSHELRASLVGGGASKYLITRPGQPLWAQPPLLKGVAVGLALATAINLGMATYFRNMDYETELLLWMDTVKKRPLNYLAYHNLGYALGMANRWTEAIPCFQKSIEISPLYSNAYANLGLALVNVGKTADALEYLRKGWQLNPAGANLNNTVGYALMHLNKPAEALPYLETAVRLDPENIDARNNLGLVLSELGQKDRARAQIELALKIKLDDPISHYHLGVVLNKSDKPAEAVPHLQKALKLRPRLSPAHYQLGLSLFTLGRFTESIPYFRNTLHFDADHFQAQYHLGLALLQIGQLEAAVAPLHKAVQMEPNNKEGNYNLGTTLLYLNKPAEAVTYLRRTIELAPDMIEAHNNLGLAWLRQNNNERAVSCFQEVLRLNPDHVEAHLNLGLVLANSGKLPEAISHFQKAVSLKPTADAYYYLGMAQAYSGITAEAIKNLQTAVTMDPRNETAKMALQGLKAKQ